MCIWSERDLAHVAPEANASAREAFQEAISSSRSSSPINGSSPQRTPYLKIETSIYKGDERENLLRWFVEVEVALAARQISHDHLRVVFAMSRLGGRAKSWAYGRIMAQPDCFPSFSGFKTALQEAFEPPRCEFRMRARFLRLRQGKSSLHDYIQQARYLVASVVAEPIDGPTQVAVFLNGLNEGPVRTQLFREHPKTMEKAISLALEEDFSQRQAKLEYAAPFRRNTGNSPFKNPKREGRNPSGPEPMDLSSLTGGEYSPNKSNVTCFKCQKKGHYKRECPSMKQQGGGRGRSPRPNPRK